MTNLCIDYDYLGWFLQCLPNLVHLTYLHSPQFSRDSFKAHNLMDALLHVRDSLQHLTVLDRNRPSGYMDPVGTPGRLLRHFPMGSFATFSNLKSITTEAEWLMGPRFEESALDGSTGAECSNRDLILHYSLFDVLPPSIEHVGSVNCQHGHEVVPQLHSFISSARAGSFENLKSMSLDWKRDWQSWNGWPIPNFTDSDVAQLYAQMRDAGLERIE